MTICIIPARGGSKRIPRKNVKKFCGKPMIAWSIESALESQCFERVIVSTDDGEIASVARQWGAEVPFIRPETLSDDYTGTIPVIAHAIEWLIKNEQSPETVCCLYATAPFVQPSDLQYARQELANDSIADYAVTVTSYAFPIQRALRLTQSGGVAMFQPEHFTTRSQDLEEAWHDAGQFYWGRAKAWSEGRALFSKYTVPIRLPRHRVQDIDTPEDWQRAEWLFKAFLTESS